MFLFVFLKCAGFPELHTSCGSSGQAHTSGRTSSGSLMRQLACIATFCVVFTQSRCPASIDARCGDCGAWPTSSWLQPRLHRLLRVSRRIFATTRQLYVFFNEQFLLRAGSLQWVAVSCPCRAQRFRTNLVDPASSHMLVSKIKPCMSQYKFVYGETANGSLKQL